jgi:hypothetical protein
MKAPYWKVISVRDYIEEAGDPRLIPSELLRGHLTSPEVCACEIPHRKRASRARAL